MDISLTRLKMGKEGTIKRLRGGRVFKRRLRTMGVREGKDVTVLTKHPMGGPLVIDIGGKHTTIGRGMAARIIVRVKR
ncbi:MAG: FeoA family protein [Candidatus Saliniplasma sp.]